MLIIFLANLVNRLVEKVTGLSNLFYHLIKNFSFLLSAKTWFEPIVFQQ